jgi:hypothetical protein
VRQANDLRAARPTAGRPIMRARPHASHACLTLHDA